MKIVEYDYLVKVRKRPMKESDFISMAVSWIEHHLDSDAFEVNYSYFRHSD